MNALEEFISSSPEPKRSHTNKTILPTQMQSTIQHITTLAGACASCRARLGGDNSPRLGQLMPEGMQANEVNNEPLRQVARTVGTGRNNAVQQPQRTILSAWRNVKTHHCGSIYAPYRAEKVPDGNRREVAGSLVNCRKKMVAGSNPAALNNLTSHMLQFL